MRAPFEKGFIEVAVKVIVAALTAFLTAITTTSCIGHGPFSLCEKSRKFLGFRLFFWFFDYLLLPLQAEIKQKQDEDNN